jgi:phosphoenolpyruvate-protein kinase (PTS system EI component)
VTNDEFRVRALLIGCKENLRGRARRLDEGGVAPGSIGVLLAEDWQPALTLVLATLDGLILVGDAATHHAAVVARELRIPCAVVDPATAATLPAPGDDVTLDAAEGIVRWSTR